MVCIFIMIYNTCNFCCFIYNVLKAMVRTDWDHFTKVDELVYEVMVKVCMYINFINENFINYSR